MANATLRYQYPSRSRGSGFKMDIDNLSNYLTLSLALATKILGSTSPLNLEPLRYLSQRWFSPQALTFPLPEGSRIVANFA